jgi:hypothetical protein
VTRPKLRSGAIEAPAVSARRLTAFATLRWWGTGASVRRGPTLYVLTDAEPLVSLVVPGSCQNELARSGLGWHGLALFPWHRARFRIARQGRNSPAGAGIAVGHNASEVTRASAGARRYGNGPNRSIIPPRGRPMSRSGALRSMLADNGKQPTCTGTRWPRGTERLDPRDRSRSN